MQIPVYHPVVLYPAGFEYDHNKRQYALLLQEKDSFCLIGTFNLGDLIRKLSEISTLALKFTSPFQELRLDGVLYSVHAFNSNDVVVFNEKRKLLKE